MATSKVLPLTTFRGRRDRRREKALALHSTDPNRIRVLRHLWRALELTGSDRAAAVWVDEYGSGLVHPFAVLDVGADRPRRSFSLDLVRRTWQQGVPGVVDVTGQENALVLPGPGMGRSAFAVSLGSDGLRAWFVVVDSPVSRPALEPTVVEELLFLAGECAGVLLHRDLDTARDASGEHSSRFTAWPVLRDAPGEGEAPSGTVAGSDEGAANRRIACRFVVARAVRALLEEDLTVSADEREERVMGVVREIERFPAPAGARGDAEVRAWRGVVDALRSGDDVELARAVLDVAGRSEELGHWYGAAELYRTAREVAAAAGAHDAWLDATRRLGRVHRHLGDWDEAAAWYEVAWEAAETLGESGAQARAMDGYAAIHILRGRLPAAREVLDEAISVAEASGDLDVHASVLHSCMTVAHTEGRLDLAARRGWQSVTGFRSDEAGRLRALTALAGVFLEARQLDAAEDAFAVVVGQVEDATLRLYALAGLALVAAHRRKPELYVSRLADLEEAGFASGTSALRAEVLLECGDGFLVLGRDDEARRWYERAVEVAEAAGLNEFLIRADEAIARLERLARAEAERPAAGAAPESFRLEDTELEEIRSGLSRMRREEAASV